MKKARYFYCMMLALGASGAAHARVAELSCEPECAAWEAQASTGAAPQASLQARPYVAPPHAWPVAASYAVAQPAAAPALPHADVTPVPEAPTYLMLLIGLGLLIFARQETRADNFSDQTFR